MQAHFMGIVIGHKVLYYKFKLQITTMHFFSIFYSNEIWDNLGMI